MVIALNKISLNLNLSFFFSEDEIPIENAGNLLLDFWIFIFQEEIYLLFVF